MENAKPLSFGERLKQAQKKQREALSAKNSTIWQPVKTVDKEFEARRKLREDEKRQRARDKAQAKAEQEKRKEVNRQAQIHINTGHVKLRKDERVLKSRVGGPNLAGKVLTQINYNTWVYLDPGADVEPVKQKIENRHLEQGRHSHNAGKSDLSY